MVTSQPTNEDAEHAFKKNNSKLNELFVRWLTAKKLASDEDEMNDGLFQIDVRPEIALDAAKRTQGQRLLLDVEKDGEMRRMEKRREDAQWQQKANLVLANSMTKHMTASLKNRNHLQQELLKLPSTYGDLISLLYSPSIKYKTIAMLVEQTQGLGKQILTLVNNTDFCQSIGRERRNIKDIQTAIGTLGLPALQMVVPLLLLKNRIKFDCEFYAMMGAKMWSHIVSMANITRLRLLNTTGSEDKAAIGTALGAISGFGLVAAHHQFHQSFDEKRESLLMDLRRKGPSYRRLYNAMVDATPDKRCIHDFLLSRHHHLTHHAAEGLEWGKNSPIPIALKEHAEHVPITERSLYGQALIQAESTARYLLLKPVAKLKSDAHGKAVRIHAQIPEADFLQLTSRDQRRIYLSDVIG